MTNSEKQDETTLFPKEILGKLDKRQAELNAGGGFEVENTDELRARLAERSIRAEAEAA